MAEEGAHHGHLVQALVRVLCRRLRVVDRAEKLRGLRVVGALARELVGEVVVAVWQREAVLEFPPGQQPRFGAPQLKASQIPPELVAKGIASAIVAGWEPLSRGKTVTIIVDETGG